MHARYSSTVQASLFDLLAEHEIGRELKAMSQWVESGPPVTEAGAKRQVRSTS